MSSITFFNEDILFKLKNKKFIKQWILKSIKAEKKIPGDICFIFCSDAFLLDMNKKYLNHNTLTDIITFDYSAQTNNISGDIFISVERVKENAKYFNVDFENELCRVMIHGVLHIIGYKDKTTEQRKKIRIAENNYLKKLQSTAASLKKIL